MKRSPVFDGKEGAILNVLYEIGSGTHTSHTLARHLNPTVQMSTPAAGVAFTETRKRHGTVNCPWACAWRTVFWR
jgi:hypothetical protein